MAGTPMDRPLSPHLGVYVPQSSSLLSIMHRVSGIIMMLACFASVLIVDSAPLLGIPGGPCAFLATGLVGLWNGLCVVDPWLISLWSCMNLCGISLVYHALHALDYGPEEEYEFPTLESLAHHARTFPWASLGLMSVWGFVCVLTTL
jgi:succinate dehydrogenase / fumarate reductase cytochrome b subunit